MTTNASSAGAGQPILPVLSRNWWALALRGVVAIVFGVLAFIWPGLTLTVLILLFGAYMLVDGIFAIVAALRAERHDTRWWLLVAEGALGVLAGVDGVVYAGLAAGAWVGLV